MAGPAVLHRSTGLRGRTNRGRCLSHSRSGPRATRLRCTEALLDRTRIQVHNRNGCRRRRSWLRNGRRVSLECREDLIELASVFFRGRLDLPHALPQGLQLARLPLLLLLDRFQRLGDERTHRLFGVRGVVRV